MVEYLKKEDVIRAIMGEYPEPRYPSWYAGLVRRMPPEDVRENESGTWLEIKDDRLLDECSNCGSQHLRFLPGNYCSVCGAKMK